MCKRIIQKYIRLKQLRVQQGECRLASYCMDQCIASGILLKEDGPDVHSHTRCICAYIMLAQMRGRLGAPCAAGRSCQPPPLHSATPRRPLRSFVVPAAASVDEVSNAPPVTTDWSADRRSSGEASTSGQEQGFDYDAPAWVRERNAVFAKQLEGKLVLAPLTKVTAPLSELVWRRV